MHGYDNAIDSMHAVFMAKGPAFVTNFTIDHFDSVQLFRLFGRLLNINSTMLPPNNGSCSRELQVLRERPPSTNCLQGAYICEIMLFLLVLLAILVLIVLLMTKLHVLDNVLSPHRTIRRPLPAMLPIRVIPRKPKYSSVTLL